MFYIINTISDEKLHKANWITKDEAKAILINRAFWRFVKECIEIDANFPAGYSVNGRIVCLEENEISGAEKLSSYTKQKTVSEKSGNKTKRNIISILKTTKR